MQGSSTFMGSVHQNGHAPDNPQGGARRPKGVLRRRPGDPRRCRAVGSARTTATQALQWTSGCDPAAGCAGGIFLVNILLTLNMGVVLAHEYKKAIIMHVSCVLVAAMWRGAATGVHSSCGTLAMWRGAAKGVRSSCGTLCDCDCYWVTGRTMKQPKGA